MPLQLLTLLAQQQQQPHPPARGARYACGACVALSKERQPPAGCATGRESWPDALFQLCSPEVMRASKLGCVTSGLCAKAREDEDKDELSPVQLRVAVGLGTKPYGTLRVSVITQWPHRSPPTAFDYSAPFEHRWKHFSLHSSLKRVQPGQKTLMPLGWPHFATLRMPLQGAGVAALLIADPCVRFGSITSLAVCTYAEKFNTTVRTPALINAFLKHSDTDFWGVLGDNWYDRTGETTARMYQKLELTTLQKPFLTVAGNHDYWILGSPEASHRSLDQLSNGMLQYYAQDSIAAKSLKPGSPLPPFNLTVDPSAAGELPAIDNSILYHQIGNVGVIGYSGAYSIEQIVPRLEEACAWLPTQEGIDLVLVVGHWDKANLGANNETDTPGVYEHVRALDGCKAYDERRALKFIMGHTHCNIPHPHAHIGTGFMVAGQGMEGCGDYGFPVLDTTEGRVRLYYFEIANTPSLDKRSFARAHEAGQMLSRPAALTDPIKDHFDEVFSCVSQSGWRACTHLAQLWLDQPLNGTKT